MPLCGEEDTFPRETPLYASMLSMHCKMGDRKREYEEMAGQCVRHMLCEYTNAVVMESRQRRLLGFLFWSLT